MGSQRCDGKDQLEAEEEMRSEQVQCCKFMPEEEAVTRVL